MGQTKDLQHTDAIAKLREIVDHNATCMLHTRTANDHMDSRPMMVQKVDDDGALWFLSSRSSGQNTHVATDPRVLLTIADNNHQE